MNDQPLILNYSRLAKVLYVIALLIFAFGIYEAFFYIEEDPFHELIYHICYLIKIICMMGVIFVLKNFLLRKVNYQRINSLLAVYLIFQLLVVFAFGKMLYGVYQIYNTITEGTFASFGMLDSVTKSLLAGLLLVTSNVVILIISFIIGYRLLKQGDSNHTPFKILGISFIVISVFSILNSIEIIEQDSIFLTINALFVCSIAYFLKKAKPLANPFEFSTETNFNPVVEKEENQSLVHKSQEETNTIDFNLELLEDKEEVLNYYNNLTETENKRLHNLIRNKFEDTLDSSDLKNEVLKYISKKRLYDHNRYLPK
jgi:hypothetical protein